MSVRGALALLLAATLFQAMPEAGRIRVGVYYFPGWSPGAHGKDPWAPIQAFPDRLPASGIYRDDKPATLRRQLDEMREAGLSYVVFDSYYGPNGNKRLDQALNAYLQVGKRGDPKFAIMWANHDQYLQSMADWDKMVDYWISAYWRDPRYLVVEGRPVIFIFSPEGLESQAKTFGSSTALLFARANSRAHAAGIEHLAWVAGGGPRPSIIRGFARSSGYTALTDYNMGTANYPAPGSGFDRRAFVYRKYWEVYRRDADLPVIWPITSGWDRRPWGGSPEDGALPTPEQFASHVGEALKLGRDGRNGFERMAVICCWNEYGEGSILEPTRANGNQYLREIRTLIGGTR